MMDMICEIDPCYKKYVLTNKKTGKKKLYRKLTKAVYSTLLGAIIFYRNWVVNYMSGGTIPEIEWSIIWVEVRIEPLQPVHIQQDD